MLADEVYYFKRPIKPLKETQNVNIPVQPSQPANTSMMEVYNEDSMDAPSVGSTSNDTPMVAASAATPVSKKVSTNSIKITRPGYNIRMY